MREYNDLKRALRKCSHHLIPGNPELANRLHLPIYSWGNRGSESRDLPQPLNPDSLRGHPARVSLYRAVLGGGEEGCTAPPGFEPWLCCGLSSQLNSGEVDPLGPPSNEQLWR